MKSYTIVSEPYLGLDGSWVVVKSVLDGQAGTTWEREKGWVEGQDLVHFMIWIKLGPRFSLRIWLPTQVQYSQDWKKESKEFDHESVWSYAFQVLCAKFSVHKPFFQFCSTNAYWMTILCQVASSVLRRQRWDTTSNYEEEAYEDESSINYWP